MNHLFDQLRPWDRYFVQLFSTSHSGPRLMIRHSTRFQRSHGKRHLEKKVQTFTVSRTSTNSLLYAKVWVNKRKSFELALIHRLKQIFVGWRKLRHVHGKVRIKVLGVVIRRLTKKRKRKHFAQKRCQPSPKPVLGVQITYIHVVACCKV